MSVNSQGEAYVATMGPGVSSCLFLFRLNVSGTGLVYGSFLGGGDIGFSTRITAVTTDAAGNAYVAGYAAFNMPTTSNALQTLNPNADLNPNLGGGIILEVNAAGSQLIYGTWFGPKYSRTTITGLAIGSDGALYFAGATDATSLVATPGAFLKDPGRGYVARLRIGASALDSFSYLPQSPVVTLKLGLDQSLHLLMEGDPYRYAILSAPTLGLKSITPTFFTTALALQASGAIWIGGNADAAALLGPGAAPKVVTSDAFQQSPNGATDAFLGQFTWVDPTVSFVGSAATAAQPFSAGQLVSIYGTQLGPPNGVSLQLGADGLVTTTLANTRVSFDGVPGALLYVGANQVNAAISCSVAGRSSTQVVVSYQGVPSAPFTMPLSPASPGLFTADGSGRGQAAALNQDYSANGRGSPASPGSIVTLYATGIGVTSPCEDGKTYEDNFPKPTLPVLARIGNQEAEILYAGQAPFLVSGVAQINIKIPSNTQVGEVPILLLVGGVASAQGVTLTVK